MTTISHHLDRRAHLIAEQGTGNADDLLTTRAVADWLGVSAQWVEIGRSKKYGPRFVRVSPRLIRYKRADVIAWLQQRTYATTAAYITQAA